MSDETDINWKTRGLAFWTWLLTWSRVHDVLAAFLGGTLTGWLLPKLVAWYFR